MLFRSNRSRRLASKSAGDFVDARVGVDVFEVVGARFARSHRIGKLDAVLVPLDEFTEVDLTGLVLVEDAHGHVDVHVIDRVVAERAKEL